MAITLRTYDSGDVDYIAKFNANVAIIEAAINALLSAQAAATTGGSALSIGAFLDSLFDSTTTLIGVGSYLPAGAGSSLTVAAGAVYRNSNQTVVQSIAPVVLSFAGQPAATYYVVPDTIGTPTRETTATEAVYSVVWTGAAFGAITRVAKALSDVGEEDAARMSTVLGLSFADLDARLEAIETLVMLRIPLTYLDVDGTLAANSDVKIPSQKAVRTYVAAEIEDAIAAYLVSGGVGDVVGPSSAVNNHLAVFDGTTGKLLKDGGVIPGSVLPLRKVGLSLDGGGAVLTTGAKGAIQVDFNGTIIGWMAIGDQVGSINVEVSLKRTSPPSVPPTAPPIPNVVTDKISASASIALVAAQSASSAAAGVSTWATGVQVGDVIQFNVASVTTLQKVTLYISIQQV